MNEKPVVAFVSVPSVNYDPIFDVGELPPFLSMPLGIMYLASSIKKTQSASHVFHIDYFGNRPVYVFVMLIEMLLCLK